MVAPVTANPAVCYFNALGEAVDKNYYLTFIQIASLILPN